MTRSIWKGPFVDGYLLKKADVARGSGRSDIIKIWSRRSTILPQFVGLTFGVYNGHKHIPGARVGGDDRPQVRRVRPDPHVSRPFRRQEGQEGLNADVQATEPAPTGGERSQGDDAHAARQSAEAEPARPTHPRQEGRDRARRSRILQKEDFGRGQEDARSRRSPTPRTTTISTSTISSSPRPGSARTWC